MTRWVRPVNAPMNQAFGNNNGQGPHPGCDYAAPMGTVVGSASDGEVIVAGQSWDGGFGYHPVCVYHPADDVTTLYGHMEAHIVSVGQAVYAGQELGLMDSQGFSTGSHLHAELRKGRSPYGNYYNSMDIDAWLHNHGAYGTTPWSPAGQLSNAQRQQVRNIQGVLHVAQDGGWGKITDDALATIRWKCLSPPNPAKRSTVVALLQGAFGFTGAACDGDWGPATDKTYSLLRYVYLNK